MSPRGTTLYDEDILSWCSQWYTCCMLMLRAREIPTWVGMQGSLDLARVQLAAAGRGGRPLFYSSAVLYSCTVYWIQYSCTTAVLQYSCTVQLQYSCTTAVIQLQQYSTAVVSSYSSTVQLQYLATAVAVLYSCCTTAVRYYSCTRSSYSCRSSTVPVGSQVQQIQLLQQYLARYYHGSSRILGSYSSGRGRYFFT